MAVTRETLGADMSSDMYPPTVNETQRKEGCLWYQRNIINCSLPNTQSSNCYCINDIEDVRCLSRFLFDRTWYFVTDGSRLTHFNSDSLDQSYANLYHFSCFVDNIAQGLSSKLVKQNTSTGNNQQDPTYFDLMLADPLACNNFRRSGQLLINVGELFSTKQVDLCYTHFKGFNMTVMLEFCQELSIMGYRMLTCTSWDDFKSLRIAVTSTKLFASNRALFLKELASIDYLSQCPRLTKGKMEIPYVPINDNTDFPTLLHRLRKLKDYMVTTFCSIRACALTLLSQGLIVAANAHVLFELLTLESLIGYRFCQEYAKKCQVLESGLQPDEEVTHLVYNFDQQAFSYRLSRHEETENLRLECLQIALSNSNWDFLYHSQEKESSQVVNEMTPYRSHCLEFIKHVTQKIVAILSNPRPFADDHTTGPLDIHISDQKRYLEKMIVKRTDLRREMPKVDVQLLVRTKDYQREMLTTRRGDLDAILHLLKQPSPIYHETHHSYC